MEYIYRHQLKENYFYKYGYPNYILELGKHLIESTSYIHISKLDVFDVFVYALLNLAENTVNLLFWPYELTTILA